MRGLQAPRSTEGSLPPWERFPGDPHSAKEPHPSASTSVWTLKWVGHWKPPGEAYFSSSAMALSEGLRKTFPETVGNH